MDSTVTVFRLSDSAISQTVTRMIWISAKIFSVRRVGQGQLEQSAIVEFVTQGLLEQVQGIVEPQMTHQYRHKHGVLYYIAHDS